MKDELVLNMKLGNIARNFLSRKLKKCINKKSNDLIRDLVIDGAYVEDDGDLLKVKLDGVAIVNKEAVLELLKNS